MLKKTKTKKTAAKKPTKVSESTAKIIRFDCMMYTEVAVEFDHKKKKLMIHAIIGRDTFQIWPPISE